MSLPNWDKGFYGSLSFFYDNSKYSIDLFKKDFEDFLNYREQTKQRRKDIEDSKKNPSPFDENKKITIVDKNLKKGHDNFASICYISASRYINKNLGLISKSEIGSELLSGQTKFKDKERFYFNKTNKKYFLTPDHISFAEHVLGKMIDLNLIEQVKQTRKINGWVNTIFWNECDNILKPGEERVGFHDKLLKKAKTIIRKQFDEKTESAKKYIEENQITFSEISDQGKKFEYPKDAEEASKKNIKGFALSFKKKVNLELLNPTENQHKDNIRKLVQILSRYPIKKLPSASTSVAKDVQDQIHAERRGRIWPNDKFIEILLECCYELEVVLYSELHEALRQRLAGIQFHETVSDEILDYESMLEGEYDEDNYSSILAAHNEEEVTSSLDIRTEHEVEKPIEDIEIDESILDDNSENIDEDIEDKVQSQKIDFEKYEILSLREKLKERIKNLKKEHKNLHKDFIYFIDESIKLLQSNLQSNIDNNKFQRGKEYFLRMEKQLIYEGELEENEDSTISLIVTVSNSI